LKPKKVRTDKKLQKKNSKEPLRKKTKIKNKKAQKLKKNI